jgi:hypothetical protein
VFHTPAHDEKTKAPVIDVPSDDAAREAVFASPRPYRRAIAEAVAARQRQCVDVELPLQQVMHVSLFDHIGKSPGRRRADQFFGKPR